MLLSVSTEPCFITRADQADHRCADGSGQPLLFCIENLLGCGYVGNRDVVHISTAWACGPVGNRDVIHQVHRPSPRRGLYIHPQIYLKTRIFRVVG
jgi:hypothetical protein